MLNQVDNLTLTNNFEDTKLSESKVRDIIKLGLMFDSHGYKLVTSHSQAPQLNHGFTDFLLEKEGKLFVGEIKYYSPTTKEMRENYLSQIKSLIMDTKTDGAILVIPSFISQKTKDYFQAHNIQIWDIEVINSVVERLKDKIAIQEVINA